MRNLVKLSNGSYLYRKRVPVSLKQYFDIAELKYSFGCISRIEAEKKALNLNHELQKLIDLKRLNMVSDNTIQKKVEQYVTERLNRDYQARLKKVSFENCTNIPKRKEADTIKDILCDYKDNISKFNVSKVQTLAEITAESLGEEFDIHNLMHKKLALELLRAQYTIFSEILSRNKGEWLRSDLLIDSNQMKNLPSIEKSIDEYLKRYCKKSKADGRQKSDVVNFFNDVAKPLLIFVNETLYEFDEESIYEISDIIPQLLTRTGKNQNKSIKEYLEKNEYETNLYKKISARTANKYFDWLKGYMLFLYKKNFVNEDFSEFLIELVEENASQQRTHFEKDEIKLLFQKIQEQKKDQDLEIFVKILAYTGMRTSEILKCTFKRDDVNHINYLDLTDTSIKLKTSSSYRKIPLHQELLGLITHSSLEQFQSKYNSETLKSLSKKANKFIHKNITEDPKKVLYSLRHSFATFLKHEMVNETSIAELMGHSTGTTMTMTRYAGLQDLKILHEAISKLYYQD